MKVRILFLAMALPLLIILGCTRANQKAADIPPEVREVMSDAEANVLMDRLASASPEELLTIWETELTEEQRDLLRELYPDDVARLFERDEGMGNEPLDQQLTYDGSKPSEAGPAEEIEVEPTPVASELGPHEVTVAILPEIGLEVETANVPPPIGLSPVHTVDTGPIRVSPVDDTCSHQKIGDDFVVMECTSSLLVYDIKNDSRIDADGPAPQNWHGTIHDIAVGDRCFAIARHNCDACGETDEADRFIYRLKEVEWGAPLEVGKGICEQTESIAISHLCDFISFTNSPSHVFFWQQGVTPPTPIWDDMYSQCPEYALVNMIGGGKVEINQSPDVFITQRSDGSKSVVFVRGPSETSDVEPHEQCVYERRLDRPDAKPIKLGGVVYPDCPQDMAIAGGLGIVAYVDGEGNIQLFDGTSVEQIGSGKHVVAAYAHRIAYENAGSVYVYDKSDGVTYTIATGVGLDVWPSISPNGRYVSFNSGGKIFMVPYERWILE